MRTSFLLVVAAAITSTGCAAGRSRESLGDGVPVPHVSAGTAASPGCAPAPALAPATGPIAAVALARETGLRYEDHGNSVLLAGEDVRARFFPGNDRVSIDGQASAMGAAARREDGGFIVPAAGADAVRRAVHAAAARRTAFKPFALSMPAAPTPSPMPTLRPVDLTPKPVAARRPAPELAWTSFCAPERAWKWIVVHHSDDDSGCCAKYDRVHRDRGWDGCGYQFVIGNGTQSGDGEVEPGPRWRTQEHGAHAKTPDNRYNDYGIGICLVGDFEKGGRPTSRQYDALVSLTRSLMARYSISSDRVLRHSDCKSTACPGKNFPWSRFVSDIGG